MQVLIIEDEVRVAHFLKGALSEEGHAVQVEHNGSTGLELALSCELDLIVLDWLLPGRSGLEICQALREAGKACPIIMLTAKATISDRIAGLDTGADDYLVKPFALGEFLARVRCLLRRGLPSLPKLRIANIVLDPAKHSVQLDGKDVALTAREYSLLEYLMRNVGRTLSRSMIAEHVWEFDYDNDTNVVDVYINYLRKKLDASHDLIRSVRGVGYKMVAPLDA